MRAGGLNMTLNLKVSCAHDLKCLIAQSEELFPDFQ